jgi:hypothetical protein
MSSEILNKDPNCSFCYYKNSNFPHFEKFGKERLDRYLVSETDHFQVKPDILPGNPDGRHLLIHPKEHVFNHATLSYYADEVGHLLYSLEKKFGPLVIFEHGGLKSGQNNQSIYHAHFHAYGGLENTDIISYMAKMLKGGLGSEEVYPFEILPAPDYAFITNLAGRFNNHPYLYVEQGNWAIIVDDYQEKMKSQVTQRSMHRLFSGEELDWKKIPDREDFARESVRRIANLISLCENGNYYPHRF